MSSYINNISSGTFQQDHKTTKTTRNPTLLHQWAAACQRASEHSSDYQGAVNPISL